MATDASRRPTPQQQATVRALLARIPDWARRRPDVRAIALVGSWAREDARADSDVDIILLTTEPDRYISDDMWPRELEADPVFQTRAWGAITERRARLANLVDVEFGIGRPEWARLDPIDDGTRRVVSDGMVILHDPDGILARLQGSGQ